MSNSTHPLLKGLYDKLKKVNASNTRKLNQVELAINAKKRLLGLKGGRRTHKKHHSRTRRHKRSNRTRRTRRHQ